MSLTSLSSFLLVTTLGLVVPPSHSFHYGLQAFAPMAMSRSFYDAPEQPQQQQPSTYANFEAYQRQQDIVDLLQAAASMNQANYDGQAQQQLPPLPYQWSAPSGSAPEQPGDVCQTGFVEHCLIQANANGEQRLMLAMAMNRTGDEQLTLASEFDGMCHVVIRFIDCLNQHYHKCSPVEAEKMAAASGSHQGKDIFLESWSKLCDQEGSVRKNYLSHAKCIRSALARDDAQEGCQARFQQFFLSGQFSLDSLENAVHFGCCGLNEWQHCLDGHIVKACGHDAVLSLRDLIEQASGHLVSSLCDAKTFSRKSKACLGKKVPASSKLHQIDPKMNATLHKYIGIFGDFIDRLPDDEEDNAHSGQ